MLATIALIFLGFVLLGVGAEMLVNGASRLALRLGVTPLVVGLTIVAFATSAPELAVSVDSTLNGLSALALGNVVGSNIANIGLILGITAIINPINIQHEVVRKQIPIMIGCSVVMGLLVLDGEISRSEGILLVLGLIVYTYLSYRQMGKEEDQGGPGNVPLIGRADAPVIEKQHSGRIILNVVLVIAGLGFLVIGSQVFVNNTITLARELGISEAIIGLTLVAVGTSVPELATSVAAALRKHSDIAIGNVVGSNIFNILSVLGITGIVGTIYADQFSLIDFGMMMVFALVLLPIARSGLVLSRLEGALLLAGYTSYIGYLGITAA